MAWRCRFLPARRSQHGRVKRPTHWLISTQVAAVLLVDLFYSLEPPRRRLVGLDAFARGDLAVRVALAGALVHGLHELHHRLLAVALLLVGRVVAGLVGAGLELGVAELRRRAADGVAGLAPVAARVDGRRLGLFGTEPAVCRRAFPQMPFSLSTAATESDGSLSGRSYGVLA